MDLNTILAKDITTLSDEESAFLREHEAELSDEQKTEYASVLDEPTDDTPAADDAHAADAAAADTEPAADAAVEASDKKALKGTFVKVEASVFAKMQKQAAAGAQAFATLALKEVEGAVSKLTFSSANPDGKFLPKSHDTLLAFMQTLNAEQRQQFSTLITAIPADMKQSFSELGDGSGNAEGSAAREVETKVEASMKANEKLDYGSALKQVFADNPALAQRYNDEVNGVA